VTSLGQGRKGTKYADYSSDVPEQLFKSNAQKSINKMVTPAANAGLVAGHAQLKRHGDKLYLADVYDFDKAAPDLPTLKKRMQNGVNPVIAAAEYLTKFRLGDSLGTPTMVELGNVSDFPNAANLGELNNYFEDAMAQGLIKTNPLAKAMAEQQVQQQQQVPTEVSPYATGKLGSVTDAAGNQYAANSKGIPFNPLQELEQQVAQEQVQPQVQPQVQMRPEAVNPFALQERPQGQVHPQAQAQAEQQVNAQMRPDAPFNPLAVQERLAQAEAAAQRASAQKAPVVVDATQGLTAGDRAYKIKKGDTLSQIAKTLGINMKELQALNKIQDANRIMAGATLRY
jgi:LysM repeat protein